MSLKFFETAPQISKDDINFFSTKFNLNLPFEFIAHYLKYNGGYPENRFFQWEDGSRTRIDHFFSIKYKKFSSLEETYTDLLIFEKILPDGYIPFAVDDGGNFFCISILRNSYGYVFYGAMFHYNPNNPSDYLKFLNSSFNDFLTNLR